MPAATAAPPYEDVAEVYDLLTAGQPHDAWVRDIERLAREQGLPGRRLLDVACGTGKSFLAMLDLGYAVTACDVSPSMVARAREVAGDRVAIEVEDMRALPAGGPYDLVTCLNDAVNHLADAGELTAFFAGARRNLAPGGLLVFDATTPLTYAQGRDAVVEDDDHLLVWRGSQARLDAGGAAVMRVDVFSAGADGAWSRRRFAQRQQLFAMHEVRAALAAAGLALRATRGQLPGGRLVADADETRHPKVLWVAARPA